MMYLQTLRVLSIIGSMTVGFWIPLRWVGFPFTQPADIFLDVVISIISVLNIHLYFKASGESPYLWRNWLKLGLWLDLVCAIPHSIFLGQIDSMLFLNLLTARHIWRIKDFLDQFDSLKPIVYRLVPIGLMMPLLVHLVACGWVALGSGTAGPDKDKTFEYVKAIYWAFTTLTTVGYGDISAKTALQMLYTCCVQVLGVGVFGFVLSNVASLLSRMDAAREHHMENLDKVEMFMDSHRIPTHLRSRVRSYYHYLWIQHRGYRDRGMLDELPKQVQSELMYHINRPIISKVPFLAEASVELIEDLVFSLEPMILVPGERIFRRGDQGDAMYFILAGEVEIVNSDNKVLARLSDGAFFGEMALVADSPRMASAKAAKYCDVYRLSKDAFLSVVNAYPEFRQHINEIVEKRKAA